MPVLDENGAPTPLIYKNKMRTYVCWQETKAGVYPSEFKMEFGNRAMPTTPA